MKWWVKKFDFINIVRSTNNKSNYGDDDVGRGWVDDGVVITTTTTTIIIITTILGFL